MENQNKWNKELLYSAIFLVAGCAIFVLHPFSTIKEFLNMLPLNILNMLVNLGAISIFSTASWVVLCLFFFLCSIYSGILSIIKAKPIASLLAYLLVLLSSVAFLGLMAALFTFTAIV